MISKSGPRPEKNQPAAKRRLRALPLDGIAYLARHQAIPVVVVAAVLVGLSLYYVRDLPIRSSYLDLLPQNDPLIAEYKEKEKELAGTDYVAVLLTLSEPPASPEERRAMLFSAADRLIANLDPEEFPRASYRVGEGIKYPPELLLYRQLTPQDIETLRKDAEAIQEILEKFPQLEPLEIEALIAELKTAFAEGNALSRLPSDQTLALLDRLLHVARGGLSLLATLPEIQTYLDEAAEIIKGVHERALPPEVGTPLLSRDDTMLVLQIWPAQPSYASLTYCREVMQAIDQAIAQAGLASLGVEASVTGTYAVVAESDQVIRKDMNFTTLVSSIGVFVLLALTFASAFLTLVALVPLLVSALLTIAWAKFAVGGFNLVTTFLPALVLGLGIDFSIHLLFRYIEERAEGRSVGRALDIAIHRKGEASLAAALTTAAVFLCLLISRSRALAEMGVIMSLGIVIAYLSAMLLTPSLIALSYVTAKRRFRERLLVRTEHIARLYRQILPQRRAVVGLTLLLTIALSYQVSQVEFRFASAQLAPETQAKSVADRILREFQGKMAFGDQFVFFVSDADELRKLEEELAQNPLVKSTDSIIDILPQELLRGRVSLQDVPVEDMLTALGTLKQALTKWEDLRSQIEGLAAALATAEFIATLSGQSEQAMALSEREATVVQLSDEMNALDKEAALETVNQVEEDLTVVQAFLHRLAALPDEAGLITALIKVLPEQLRSFYYSDASGRFVLRAYMSMELYADDNLSKFVNWVKGLGVDYFGIPEVQNRLEAYMKRDFALSTALASLLIALLVWGSFGSLKEALLAVTPLAIGYLWMLAGMRLLGIAFNFTNIVISPLLIGIGVDSAIHILHRIEEERHRGGDAAVWGAAATAVPVISTSLTTMLVFGTLIAARTPGLRFLGISALLGLGFTLLASILVLPCATAWLDGSRRGH